MRKPVFKLVTILLLFTAFGLAQNTDQKQQPSSWGYSIPGVTDSLRPGAPQASSAPQAQPSPSPQASPQPTPSHRLEVEPVEKEHKITPAEAKELFQSVDEVLHFASRDTGLPIKKSVKRTVVSREQVEKYIGDKFKNDADRIRFERSELVQKKFGLLPRDF